MPICLRCKSGSTLKSEGWWVDFARSDFSVHLQSVVVGTACGVGVVSKQNSLLPLLEVGDLLMPFRALCESGAASCSNLKM